MPSLPAIVTLSALLAVTVSVAEAPAAMELGLAAMLTVGCGGGDTGLLPALAPHPATNRERRNARPGATLVPRDLR